MTRKSHTRPALRFGLLFVLVSIAAGTAGCGSNPSESDSWTRAVETERIRETLRLYALFLDDGRVEDFVDLFTEDASITAAGFAYEGRPGIRKQLADKQRRPGKHLPFPAIIELISATEARAWSDFLRVKIEREGDPTSWKTTSIGRYYDLLEKSADGRWRFKRRDVQLPGMSNLEDLVEPGILDPPPGG